MTLRFLTVILFCSCCAFAFSKPLKLKTGTWYSSLQLTVKDQLPFLLEVKKSGKSYTFCIINGSERILLDEVKYGQDSVFIKFPVFSSELRARVDSKKRISGHWHNYAKKGNYKIPFSAKLNDQSKYPIKENDINIDGRWEVFFGHNTSDPYKAIGLFENDTKDPKTSIKIPNRITGTFLTETGDYRFLEGATINDSLYLSTFDGSHAFLFKAVLKNDTLWGKFLSGKHYSDSWFAVRNSDFELADPDSLTYLTSKNPIAFSLPALDGSTFSYPEDAQKGKVTLIQIMGTWCPNCLDESRYLRSLSEKHGEEIQIIGVTYETQKNLESKIDKVTKYKESLKLPYTLLIGGDACKSCAAEQFPMLNDIISFPTLIFIDKKGNIRKIHTGFNGPGTGVYYDQFVEATNEFVQLLISEEI